MDDDRRERLRTAIALATKTDRPGRKPEDDSLARSERGPPQPPPTPVEDIAAPPRPLSAIELLRIAPLEEAARLAGVSERTLRRNFADRIIQISPRRQGMRVRDALLLKQPEIAGTA